MGDETGDVLGVLPRHDAALIAVAALDGDDGFHAALGHEHAGQIVQHHHVLIGHAVDGHGVAEGNVVIGAVGGLQKGGLVLVADEGHIAVHLLRVVTDGLQQAADGGDGVGLGQRGGDDVGSIVGRVAVGQLVQAVDAVSVLLLHQGVAGELTDDVLGGDQKTGVVGVGAVQRELHAAVHGQGVAFPAVGHGALRVSGAVGLARVIVAETRGGQGGDLNVPAPREADLPRFGDHPRGSGGRRKLLVDELLVCLCVIKCHNDTSGIQILGLSDPITPQ